MFTWTTSSYSAWVALLLSITENKNTISFATYHYVIQARSCLYANTQLRAHRRAETKIKSKKNMEDRLPEPITLQTRQNSIGKFLCTMRL
jgi:hypothetical protein